MPPAGSVARGLVILAVAAVLGLAAMATGAAQGEATARIEVRVWQDVGDELDIQISARPAAGSWRTLGTIPLPLDDGVSSTGYNYGDISLDVPLANWASPVTVEVRVWQNVGNSRVIYISARPSAGSWQTLGTIRLPLDDGFSSTGRFRFGDIGLDVPFPEGGVRTLAGTPGLWGFRDGSGEHARFGGWPRNGALGLTVDRDGSVVVADRWNHAIRRVALDGTVTTIAGGNGVGLEDGPAETARFNSPRDVVVDAEGSIYVADGENHRIRKITPEGVVSTIAGSDRGGADWREIRDGPSEQALFAGPTALVLDPYGDLYIVERFAVRRLSPSGWVSTFAGDNGWGWRDGPREVAQFQSLYDIAVDDAGNLYVIDDTRGSVGSGGTVLAIRKIDTSGIVTTLYRDGYPSLGGTLAYPSGLAVTGDGTVYLANTGRHQIVRLTAEGQLRAVAGTGEKGHLDGPHGAANFSLPRRIAFSPDGALIVADQDGSVVRRVVPGEGGPGAETIPLADFEALPRVSGVRVRVYAGAGDQGFVDGPAGQAQFVLPRGLAVDGSGNVIVADGLNEAIRAIAPDGTVTTVAGGSGKGARDGPCEEAQFGWPVDVAVDAGGSIYVADSSGNSIRRIDTGADCSVTTVAGQGPVSSQEEGWGGFRDGPAAAAEFRSPGALAFDSEGNLFIADTENNLIRRLSPGGQVSTIAGPAGGFRGNLGTQDGQGEYALFSSPRGIAVDSEGNVFFTEANNAIRRIDRSGFVSTVISTPDYGEGGALSPFLIGIAVGPDGELYIADGGFGRVLRLTRDGILSIVADAQHSVGSRRLDPNGIVVAPDGDLFISDSSTSSILKITFEDEGDE